MAVSSMSNASTAQNVQIDVMKKAQEVQAQQVLKVLESANEQSQQVAAQKTGIGQNINILA